MVSIIKNQEMHDPTRKIKVFDEKMNHIEYDIDL